MSETWDTAKIREAFIYDGGESEYYDPISGAKEQRRIAGEIFDRWLAAHDADVREAERERAALHAEEGYRMGEHCDDIAKRIRSGEPAEITARPVVAEEPEARAWEPADGDKRCQECGRENPVWWADNDDWNAIMPDDGVLCPTCYHRAWLEARPGMPVEQEAE